MAIDITALYCCLDDFCKVFGDWEAHRLIPSQTTRQRTIKLSRAEMLFIMQGGWLVRYSVSPPLSGPLPVGCVTCGSRVVAQAGRSPTGEAT
jgi:hypothetical protein